MDWGRAPSPYPSPVHTLICCLLLEVAAKQTFPPIYSKAASSFQESTFEVTLLQTLTKTGKLEWQAGLLYLDRLLYSIDSYH